MKIDKGQAWKLGDNINTDNLSPGYYISQGMEVLAEHCLEAVRPEFAAQVQPGDIILGGENFGTGSSRETAPAVLKYIGVSAIVAKSFARIFYRNAVNIALPIFISHPAYESSQDGDRISTVLSEGLITNHSRDLVFETQPPPRIITEIYEAGGLIKFALKNNWHLTKQPTK
jgi:3-isopropylmalate dehydratase small subunit